MVNNKVLSGILIATMFIAVFGTLISLNKIDGIAGMKGMTGAWAGPAANSTYASVNITISSLLRINFTLDNASFGSGYVAAGQSACVLSTGETTTDTRCTGWNTPGMMHGFLLENIGNELAEVNISNSNWSESLFGDVASKYAWKWDALNNSDGTGNNNANVTCNETDRYSDMQNAFRIWVNTSASAYPGSKGTRVGQTICSPLNNSVGDRGINITFKLQIDSSTGARIMDDLWFAYARAL